MTEKEYRDCINGKVWQHRLTVFLKEIKTGKFDFVLDAISKPEFSEDATTTQLYDFQSELFQLYSRMNGSVKEIKDSQILINGGEFDDRKMTFKDVGIDAESFECTTSFSYDGNMEILPGTIVELKGLHFANYGSRVSVVFSTLVADAPDKVIEAFNSGIQANISLKDLGDNFKPI